MRVAVGEGPPLVERDRELASLSAVASEVARARAPRLVLVTGDGGVGKSRLVAELVATLPDGWVVTRVGGDRTDPSWSAPFAPIVDDVADGGGDPARALAAALGGALRARAAGSPSVLVVDDLQLIDPLASVALRHLLVELRADPALVVATYRLGAQRLGSPHARAVTALLRHPSATELRLAPLSPDAVATLGTWFCPEGLDAAELYRRSEGNPFLVEQLATTTGAAIPETIEEVVAASLADLDPAARELVELLAASGRALPGGVLRALDPTGASTRALLDAAFAVSDGPELRLRHALLAEAVMARLVPAERRARHRRLAELLDADPTASDDNRARQWAEAGDLARAAPLAVAAADRLEARGVHASAVDLYRIALAADPEVLATVDDRATILEKASTAAALAGDEALASAWADGVRDADHAAGPARSATATWGNPLFQRLARERRGGAPPAGSAPATDDVSARILEAKELVRAGAYERAARIAHAAAADARLLGDRVLEADAALLVGYAGDLPEGLAMLEAVTEAARDAGDVGATTVSLGRRSRLHIASGDLNRGLECNLRSLAVAKATGEIEFWANPATGTAFIHALRGEVVAARGLGEELMALELPVFTVFAQGVEWIVAIEEGRSDAAAHGADLVLPVARAFGDEYFLVPMLMLGGRTALLCGDAAGAHSLFAEAEEAMWSPLHEQAVDVIHGQVQSAAVLGDEAALARAVDRAATLARAVPGPSVQAAADHAHGVALRAAGREDEASQAFERAALAAELSGRRPLALDAWIAAAGCATGGRRDHAASAALAIAAEHGLGRPGLADLARSPVSQPVDPLEVLGTRERRIVELAAAGRTNREIGEELYISEKTVRNQLTAAFAKLGVKRRGQLGALVGVPS